MIKTARQLKDLIRNLSRKKSADVERRKGKPEESKTVRQWALLGRIPIDAMKPSYISQLLMRNYMMERFLDRISLF